MANEQLLLFDIKEPEVPVSIATLGRAGRESVIDPNRITQTGLLNAIIKPQEVTKFADRNEITVENTCHLTQAQKIKLMIRSSAVLRGAVDTYIDYVARDFEVVADNVRDKNIIHDFIERSGGKQSHLNFLRQLAYSSYVEVGPAAELIFSEGIAEKMVSISSFSLSAREDTDEKIGEYYVYGQGTTNSNFRILIDERDPDKDTTLYIPTNIRGDEPFGASAISAAVNSLIEKKDLLKTLLDFARGRVYPKHVYYVDVETLSKAGYSSTQIQKAADHAVALLEGEINTSDITQDHILSIPVQSLLIGAMERAGIDGLELIEEMLDRDVQPGLGIPRVLYGNRRPTTGLNNDSESEYEILDFYKGIRSVRAIIEALVTKLYELILLEARSQGTAELKLDDSDEILKKILSEFLKLKAEAFIAIKSLGLFTDQELREKFILDDFDFGDLDIEMPEELVELQQIQMDIQRQALLPSQGEEESQQDD